MTQIPELDEVEKSYLKERKFVAAVQHLRHRVDLGLLDGIKAIEHHSGVRKPDWR